MKDEPFRMALREEGKFWNCYIAGASSMKNKILVGSIMMRVIEEQPEIKARFMKLMQDSIGYVLEQTLGIPIKEWGKPESAPAKDRTKPRAP